MWTSPDWSGVSCCSRHSPWTHVEGRPLPPSTPTGALCCYYSLTLKQNPSFVHSLCFSIISCLFFLSSNICCLFILQHRFLESLLRQASNALIVHCPTMHCFVNQTTDNEPSFRAEEFSDISGGPQGFITAQDVMSIQTPFCVFKKMM